MDWVPMPNKQDGDGYTELLDHPNGAAHFGAWCALLEVASRRHVGDGPRVDARARRESAKYDATEHPYGRGILMRENGEPYDAKSLERITRIPVSVWEEVLPRLVSIGWITGYKVVGSQSAHDRQSIGARSRTDAVNRPMNGTERNGTERNNGAVAPIEKDAELYASIKESFLSKNDGKFSNYGKEGKAIHALIEKAKARAPDDPGPFLQSMIEAFWALKQTGNEFWKGQPFLSSALNASGIWDRVLETMRNQEAAADPEALAIASGEIF